MRKALSYILPLAVGLLGAMPPLPITFAAPPQHWQWIITCAALMGMWLLFFRISLPIKLIVFFGLINCFFSGIPYISFNMYVSLVLCCYFYVGLTKMETWGPMFRMVGALLLLNFLMMFAQILSHDQLLNFGLEKSVHLGVVGQHMQEASFIVIACAILTLRHPIFIIVPILAAVICNSAWAVFCSAAGIWAYFPSKRGRQIAIVIGAAFLIMAWCKGKFAAGFSEFDRWEVWMHSLDLASQRPWQGWGIGTYKIIFPALGGIPTIPWMTAHNDWVQLLFELGRVLFSVLMLTVFWMYNALRKYSTVDARPFAAFVMISTDMIVHFPSRMVQCVLLFILFLAYCDLLLSKRLIKFK